MGEVPEGFEAEWRLPRPAYHALKAILSPFEHMRYEKMRETYHPIGDDKVHICLDDVKGLGPFIEVEAQSPAQVLRWKNRLGITGDPIPSSYTRMITQGGYQPLAASP